MEQLKSWLSSIGDSLPPYHLVEGPLKGKEPSLNGTYYLKIGLTKVEVDAFTYDSLQIGELLRIRCTRSQKAINIDRIIPPQNGSK